MFASGTLHHRLRSTQTNSFLKLIDSRECFSIFHPFPLTDFFLWKKLDMQCLSMHCISRKAVLLNFQLISELGHRESLLGQYTYYIDYRRNFLCNWNDTIYISAIYIWISNIYIFFSSFHLRFFVKHLSNSVFEHCR